MNQQYAVASDQADAAALADLECFVEIAEVLVVDCARQHAFEGAVGAVDPLRQDD